MLTMVTYVRQQCVGSYTTHCVLLHSPTLSDPLKGVCTCVGNEGMGEREGRGREGHNKGEGMRGRGWMDKGGG